MTALALVVAVGLALDGGTPDTGATFRLEVSGVRSDKGQVLVALYRQGDGFAETKSTAFRKGSVPATKGTVVFELSELPVDTYALAIFHDENDNQKLDTGLFSIPLEGYCFSKNARGTFGPPSFKDAAVAHSDRGTTHTVTIKY